MNPTITIPKHITAETVDGETIVINFLSGAYHTLSGPCAELWSKLTATESFQPDERELPLIADLVAAEILAVAPNLKLPAPSQDPAARGLKSYTDMAAILLADPIHEVGPQGWPKLRDDKDVPAGG